MILKMLVVGPFGSNCYIVGSESTKRGMIIDPGADAKTILKTVDELGLSIVLVVATHTHPDHIGALRPVKEATGADYAVHESSGGEAMQALSQMFASMVGGSFGKLPEPDRLLKENDIIEIDDLTFTVLHTPGHGPGDISLLGHGVVFSGDTLFNFSIGRTDFPGGDYPLLINSIHTKLMNLSDDTIVYPGHMSETTIGAERRMNPFLRSANY